MTCKKEVTKALLLVFLLILFQQKQNTEHNKYLYQNYRFYVPKHLQLVLRQHLYLHGSVGRTYLNKIIVWMLTE